jgi:hypothetical protein
MSSVGAVLITVAACLAGCVNAPPAATPEPDALVGTVTIVGCDLEAGDLQVAAVPIAIERGAEGVALDEPIPTGTVGEPPSQTTRPTTTPTPSASPTPTRAVTPTPTRTRRPSESPRPTVSDRPPVSDRPAVSVTPTPSATSMEPTPSATLGEPPTQPPAQPTPTASASAPTLVPPTVPIRPPLPTIPVSPPPPPSIRVKLAAQVTEDDALNSGVQPVRVVRTAPGTFAFTLPAREPGELSQVRLRVTKPGCQDVAWTPLAGLVMGAAVAGGPAVRIAGEVIDTDLQVFPGTSTPQVLDGRVVGTWATEDVVDPDAGYTEGGRVFRWSSGAPGVVSGRWELSAVPFGETCAQTGSILMSGEAAYVPGPFTPAKNDSWFRVDAGLVPAMVAQAATGSAATGGATQLTPSARALVRALQPTSAWVRVVPLDASGQCAGAPSNSVRLDFGSPASTPGVGQINGFGGAQPLAVQWAEYTPFRPRLELAEGAAVILVTADHVIAPDILNLPPGTAWAADPMGFLLASRRVYEPGATVPAGQRIVLWAPTDDDDYLDEFGDAVLSAGAMIIDGVAYFADWFAVAYEDIKGAVVAVVATVIDEVGIADCGPGSACRDGLMAGLEAGLMALGLPPSLPDFEELAALGTDYLVEQVVAATGLPPAVAQQVVEVSLAELAEQGRAGASSGVGGVPAADWWVSDAGPRPGRMVVRLSRPADSPAGPNVGSIQLSGEVYRGLVAAPQLAPGDFADVPVLLVPSLGSADGEDAWVREVFRTSDRTVLVATAGPVGTGMGRIDIATHTTKWLGVEQSVVNGALVGPPEIGAVQPAFD